MNKMSKVEDQRAMTSMRVFREFVKRSVKADGSEVIDASGVISRECYELWVNTRKILPPNPEKAFQRSLSAHVTGVDGRVPFTPQEEEAVLMVLRRKERWPCFEASSTRFGLMGFRAKGFHEKSSDGDFISQADGSKRFRQDDESSDGEMTQQGSLKDNQYVAVSGNIFPHAGTCKEESKCVRSEAQSLMAPDGSLAFLETANALLRQFSLTGVEAWGTVLSVARMLLVSKGWAQPPTMDDAVRLLKEYCELYPTVPVVIIDPTTRQGKDRIMALSPKAQAYLGPIARDQNGLTREVISKADGWNALTAAFAAFKSPGMEFVANLNISCMDHTIRPVLTSFTLRPNERLMVVRGIPLA